jgi:hypothetical protein
MLIWRGLIALKGNRNPVSGSGFRSGTGRGGRRWQMRLRVNLLHYHPLLCEQDSVWGSRELIGYRGASVGLGREDANVIKTFALFGRWV